MKNIQIHLRLVKQRDVLPTRELLNICIHNFKIDVIFCNLTIDVIKNTASVFIFYSNF